MKSCNHHNREDLANLLERRGEIVDRALTYAYLLSVLDQRCGQQGDSDPEGDTDGTCGEEDSEPPNGFASESAVASGALAEGGWGSRASPAL